MNCCHRRRTGSQARPAATLTGKAMTASAAALAEVLVKNVDPNARPDPRAIAPVQMA
ncbi:hypothetical protein ACWT_2408 [Actinoplanes sp. SE50]|nr:hypothetical protein ACPL_2535 [Actinoplanes sp. SE50/110]ATO81823.1 hypothetical protein ACWT_2408 [Actinoplanes sp. SE50]SLL99231.1 hypothetical protein ACSP50_2462 [Actinoplanes sp. SE50/110]